MIRLISTLLFCNFYFLLSAQLDREQVQVIMDIRTIGEIQVEDLDGDGDKDIIGNRAGYNGSFVTYFNLDGQGTFSSPLAFGDTTWWGRHEAEFLFDLGDMDNDSDPDLVTNHTAGSISPYYINDGNGNFSLPEPSPEPGDELSYNDFFKIADIDNDGLQDVVIFKGNTKELYYNHRTTGETEFQKVLIHEPDLPLSGWQIEGLILFDYDLDGDLDYALLAVEGDGSPEDIYHIYIYEQTCTLCFEEKNNFTVLESAYAPIISDHLTAADMNGDAYPELLLHYVDYQNTSTSRDHLLIWGNQNGSGNFITERDIIDVAAYAITDFNQDEQLDLFIGFDSDENADSKKDLHYYWYENEGNYEFTTTHLISEEDSGNSIIASDINQDNIPDLLSLQSSNYTTLDGGIGLREGQNDQSFGAFRSINLVLERVSAIAQEDWDNDGDQDLLFFGYVHSDGALKDGIYRATNQGEGQFDHPFLVYSTTRDALYEDIVDLNGDGQLDAIGLENITGPLVNRKLYYTLQQQDGSWGTSTIVSSDLPFIISQYTVADWDNDADADVLVSGYGGELMLLKNELNATGSFTPILLDITFNHTSNTIPTLWAEDFNQDGTADILLLENQKILYAQNLSAEPEYTEWDTLVQPNGMAIFSYQAADFTADGYPDVLALGRQNGSNFFYALASFNPINNTFLPFRLLNNDAYGNPNLPYHSLVDLNHDGAMDLITGNGFRINQANGTLFTNGYLPEPIENYLEAPFMFYAIQADIDGDQQTEIVSGHWSIMAYDYDFLNRSTLNGTVRLDTTDMCQTDDTSTPLSNWLVSTTGPTQGQLSTTNNTGNYATLLPETGDYQIQVLPPSGYWAVCPADTLIAVLDSTSIFNIDFAAEALIDCPLVVIDISSSSIPQCFESAVSISYQNVGTAFAEDIVITLAYDSRLTPSSSTPAWTSITDSTLVYDIGGVQVGEGGFISIHFEPDCENLILDEELCFEATVTPSELCEDMLIDWDGANLEAEVLCEDGNLAYRIVNTGEGAMTSPETYLVSIVNDDIILYLSGGVILGPGEADTIPLPASEDTWYLHVEQTAGHPYPVPVSLIANDCEEDNSAETTNLLPNGTGNPFVASLCRTVIGPYDPNDKTAIPIGLGDDHEIERTWPLDYTIQFQNVGSDRARTVILHDQLSDLLDLSTFEPGPASHGYEWHLLDERLLIVTFPDINLPDSTNNATASQGFFSFRIQPRSDAPFDAIIENHADIYFDFNTPIRTGTVFHTIRKPVFGDVTINSICPGDSYLGVTINQDTTLEYRYEYAEYDSVHWHHISVFPPQLTEVIVSLEEAGWWEGIYITQDTTITDIQTDVMGCDSTIVYQLQLLTNTDQIALNQAVQIQPNPAQNDCWLSWPGLSSPELILVYNQLGQQVGEYHPKSDSKQYNLATKHLTAGSYNVRLHWKDKQANTVLQVIR